VYTNIYISTFVLELLLVWLVLLRKLVANLSQVFDKLDATLVTKCGVSNHKEKSNMMLA